METVDVTKKSILQEKVVSLLEKNQSTTKAVLEKIQSDGENLNDSIVRLGVNSPLEFINQGGISASFDDVQYSIHPHAFGQIADKFNIPRKYANYLNETPWGRELLQKALTTHTSNVPRSRLLIRAVGTQIRGVLSDKYRRLNSERLLSMFINTCKEQGARIYEAHYTDTKTYLSAILPQVIPVPTENNGVVYSVFGARISHSDYGDGSLDVRGFQMNTVCLNGMVAETMLKQIHLGKKLPENINFSNETYRLDTETSASAIKDIISTVLGTENILNKAKKIQTSSSKLIELDKEIIKLPKMGMLKEEVELVGKKIVQGTPDDGIQGAMSQWKLAQAINSVGKDLGGTRKHELDEIAGKLLKF